MSNFRVTAVVPNWNGRPWLALLLRSIARQTLPMRVVVVDNGSRDGSVDYMRTEFPHATTIALHRNTGFSHAVNRGIAVSATEYVALLNNDVEIDADWARRMVLALDADPGLGSAACKILGHRDRSIIDGAGDAFYWSGSASPRGHGQRDRGQYDAAEHVFGARAAAALYRRTTLAAVGAFDERFFAYYEDVDWAFRAQLQGWRCRYVATAVAVHRGSETMQRVDGRQRAHFWTLIWRNELWTVAKNYPGRALATRLPKLLIAQLLGFISAARAGLAWAYLRGVMLALAGLPMVVADRRRVQRTRVVSMRYLDSVISSRIKPV